MLKILDEICTPTKGSKYSACIDLYAREDVMVWNGDTKIVPLGVCIDRKGIDKIVSYNFYYLPTSNNKSFEEVRDSFLNSYYLELHPRSSLRAKGIVAGVGVVDMDYKDEIKIILHNLNATPFNIYRGDKIAQIMLKEHKSQLLGVDTDTERNGGFGSTGG